MPAAQTELSRYLETTPKSRALWEDARSYLPGGDSRNSIFWKPYPIFIESASGCHVVDADGVDRLDFINTMTTMILGHGPAEVIEAVTGQLSRGLAYNGPSPHQVRFGPAALRPGAFLRPGAVHQLRHRGHPEHPARRPRLHRQDPFRQGGRRLPRHPRRRQRQRAGGPRRRR